MKKLYVALCAIILVNCLIFFSIDLSLGYTVTIRNIYTMNEGNIYHSTARGTIDLVHRFEGVWFVFHGESRNPCCAYNGFQTSLDGVTWSGLKTGLNADSDELNRSYLIEDKIITRLYKNPTNDGLYISEGIINGNDIIWDAPHFIITGSYYYYNDVKRDFSGRLHFSGRHYDGSFTNIFWMRAKNPYDNSAWESPVILLSGNTVTPRVDGHENIQLGGNEVYVIIRTATNNINPSLKPSNLGSFYGMHYNGKDWETVPTELGISDGIAGSDKRLSAIFDPNTDTIHLVYIDDNDNLYHKTLKTPYNSDDWTSSQLIVNNAFCCILGIDTTVSPSRIALVYGDQLVTDPSDGRNCTGALYLKWFDGRSWEIENLLISEPGETYNWYPNMIRDVSGDIGVMYQKGDWTKSSQEIMFSLIIQPDSDGDSITDKIEVISGTEPYDVDTDNDGLFDGEDLNPLNPDSNIDGVIDH